MFFQKQFWKCEDTKPPKKCSKRQRSSSRCKGVTQLQLRKNIRRRQSSEKQKKEVELLTPPEIEDEILQENVITPQQQDFLQLQEKIRLCREQSRSSIQVTSRIQFYFHNLVKVRKYQSVIRNIGIRSYNTISKYVLRKRFLPKIEGEVSKVLEVLRFKFQKRQLLVVVKNKNKSNVELSVSEFKGDREREKESKMFSAKRVLPVTEYKRYSCIHNYLMVNFETKQVYTIDQYLKNKADFRLLVLVYRTRIRLQLKTYKYKSRFTLRYFFQNHIIRNYPDREIIFFAKIFTQKGVLKLSLESISETGVRFTVPISVIHDNYQLTLQNYLGQHHISLTRNRAFKRIEYSKFIPQIKKIQSVFKGFHEFNSYQQYKLQHPEWCTIKCDPAHKQFITCITKQFCVVLAYESQLRDSPHTFKYKLRYTHIINQQFSAISTIESQATFIDMIGRINNRIQTFELNSSSDYKKRLQKFKEVLFRFLFKYKNRRFARLNYHQIKRIPVEGEVILIMARNSPKIAQSYQISMYNLQRTSRHFSFTIKKETCSKQIQSKEIEKLFYLSYNHCILKPARIKDRHYIIDLKAIPDEENVYFYEVYQEKKMCFYLEVYKGRNHESYESIFRKEIPKKELAEMNVEDLEREVMQVIRKQGGLQ